MKKNLGTFDRFLRLGFGIVAIILAYWNGGGWLSWLLVFAAIAWFISAAISWCPCFYLMGKNSCKTKK